MLVRWGRHIENVQSILYRVPTARKNIFSYRATNTLSRWDKDYNLFALFAGDPAFTYKLYRACWSAQQQREDF